MTESRLKLYTILLVGLLAPAVMSSPGWAAAGSATEVIPAQQQVPAEQSAVRAGSSAGSMRQYHSTAIQPVGAAAAEVLTCEQALGRALASHPALTALEQEYWALDSLSWQAGRRPNPELELEFEEFGGTQEASGIDALAASLTYSQLLERGGKREKRETAAALERELVKWDIAELEHEIQAQVRTAYSACQAAQYQLAQLQRYRDLVLRIHDTISAGVDAGRNARLELERFEIELARLELEVRAAERALAQARLELAATWGATSAEGLAVSPLAEAVAELPALAELDAHLSEHPAVARYDAEYEALCAVVDLEHANAVGDMALFGGVTRLNEIAETVFKVGVAWELPLNDRNAGNISAAGYRLEQVADRRAAVRRALATELAALNQLARNAQDNHAAYAMELLPAANEALALTEEGYRYGKFSLLDVLDAQRTVLELEREQAGALTELRLRLAEIEALIDADLAALVSGADEFSTAASSAAEEAEYLHSKEHDHD